MGDMVVNGINFLIIVFGMVEFAKKMDVRGKALTALSMALGVIAGVSYQLAQMYPVFGKWFGVIVFGIAVGMAASGIYDFANARWPKFEQPEG